MKNIYFTLFLILCINFSFAQSLVVTGDTYFYGNPIDEITHHLDVKNVSGNSITVICQKNIISSPATLPNWAGAYYCFAGNCYAASSTAPSTPATLNAGQTFSYDNSDLDAFSGYYNPAEIPGIQTVEYCFYDSSNVSDISCVTITYDISSSSTVNDFTRISEFYPNPSNADVQFEYYSSEPAVLNLIDVLGNKVKSINLVSNRTYNINVSNLSHGMYFGNVVKDNEIVSIKKLIVK